MTDISLVVDDPARSRRKRATIIARSKDEAVLSDATCTPEWLADMLPEVDFDPCSNPRSCVRSRWSWSLEKGYDGLRMPWRGSGFVNWPYSDPMPWTVKAMAELNSGRCTDLIILCKFDPSTKWWKLITGPVYAYPNPGTFTLPDLWAFHDRIQFNEHPEIIARRRDDYARADELFKAGQGPKPKGKRDGSSSSNFVSVIIHHRDPTAEPLSLKSVADLWRRIV